MAITKSSSVFAPALNRRKHLFAYLVAVLAVAIATVARLLLDPWLGDDLPYITYFAAIVIAAWFGRLGPSLFSVVLSCVTAEWFFVQPRHSFKPSYSAPSEWVGLVTFLIVGAIVAALSESLHRARQLAGAHREWLRVALNSIGDAVIVADSQGSIVMMNPIAEQLTGWKSAEAISRPLEEPFRIINEHTRKPVDSPCAKVLATGRIIGLANHTVLIARDGTERPIDDSAAPIVDETGKILGVVLVFRDATETRRAQENAERLSAIVEGSEDAIIGKNLNGVITSWNAAAERLYGFTAQETIGQPISMIVPPDLQSDLKPIMDRLRHGERIEHLETVRLTKDGRPIEVALSISPIKNAYGEVIGASKIARDIGERKRLEAQLRQYIADLSEADRRKDEFLAMLAHELRNPLAAIDYSMHLLSAAPEQLPLATDTIKRQVRQLTHLVDDLLDVSRITSDRVQLRKESIDASVLVNRAIGSALPFIEERNHKLDVEIVNQEMPVYADPARIEQVIVNLLTNAAKYTPDHGLITVKAYPENKHVMIKVEDTGVGIPREMLTRVFELFTQVDPSIDRSKGGLGIGLTVVRHLTEMHGGMVSATSEGLGKGSEFSVYLPVSDVHSPVSKPPKPETIRPGLRVLVVDDNVDSARTLGLLLEKLGCVTAEVHDGLQVIDAATSFQPDAILLDIGLPGLDGYHVARLIRQTAELSKVRLIAITGYGQKQDRDRSNDAGFDEHLVKPVQFDSLVQSLAANR